MASKIIEKIIEPSKIEVGSKFLIKIKVERIKSYNLVTETSNLSVEDINNMSVEEFDNIIIDQLILSDNSFNIVTENDENLITEGDYYE